MVNIDAGGTRIAILAGPADTRVQSLGAIEAIEDILAPQQRAPVVVHGNADFGVADEIAPLDRLWRAANDVEADPALIFISEEHTSELQSIKRNSYAVCFLKKQYHKHAVNKHSRETQT